MASHRIACDWSSLGAGVELVFADIGCHLGMGGHQGYIRGHIDGSVRVELLLQCRHHGVGSYSEDECPTTWAVSLFLELAEGY